MNNFTFGDETFGYYETIAGGAGAGPDWDGVDAVQSHMTNTRITDPEILESRVPAVLLQFAIRKDSGGRGFHRGGNGVVREFLFKSELTVSVLSERRVFQPEGLKGGMHAARGVNTLVYPDGREVNVGGKCSIKIQPGSRFKICTPGGGGYGCEKTYDPQSAKWSLSSSAAIVELGSLTSFQKTQEQS